MKSNGPDLIIRRLIDWFIEVSSQLPNIDDDVDADDT